MNKKIFYGLGVIPIAAFALFVAMPAEEEKTYIHETTSFPPPEPLSTYSDYFVDSVQEASEIVGYAVSEPVLPDGTTLQLIGIHGDGVVLLYASPHQISERTLDREFTYDLQGILIIYQRIPDRLSHLGADALVERWAEGEDIETSLMPNGRIGAVREMGVGQGISGTFDMPAIVTTSISDDVEVSISGFYGGDTLESLLAD